jgi:hypothetical protein
LQSQKTKESDTGIVSRQGLQRIARKGGGRWAAGVAERPEGATDRDYAAHGLPTADYERKARRRACEPGRPNKKTKT